VTALICAVLAVLTCEWITSQLPVRTIPALLAFTAFFLIYLGTAEYLKDNPQ
jgi:putative Ca2+/H+ antiporter (TMEM165/GDT1 family)